MNTQVEEPFRDRLLALLPKSLFGQFFVAIITAVVLSTLAGISINAWVARGLLYEMQSELGNAELRGVVDVIGRTHAEIDAFREGAIDFRKESLRHLTQLMGTYIGELQREVAAGRMSLAQAKRTVVSQYSQLRYGEGTLLNLDDAIYDKTGDYMFAIDNRYVTVVHPNADMRVNSSYNLRDSDGIYIVRELVRAAREADQATKGSFGYTQYRWPRIRGAEPEPKLSAVTYFRPWDWVIGTGVYLGDIEAAVKARRAALMEDLRKRLAAIRIGKTGYLFLFDESCNVIAHPVLQDKSLAAMRDPDTGAFLCDELKSAAGRPGGDNILYYRWDRPDAPGRYVYPKMSWIVREPSTGWYVASSVYRDEVEAPTAKLRQGVLISALATIALLGIAVFFLLRNLLRPIQDLSRVCRRIGEGDFSVRANEGALGEMGSLCRRFNGMVQALNESHDRELQRQRELAELNQNLEREVQNRTQDLSRKAEELKEANQRLLEVDSMKSNFLSSVSHELRTPLTSVLGFAKLISKDFGNVFLPLVAGNEKLARRAQRVGQNLDIIIREGERLTRLINDVLDLAKIEAGRVEWHDSVVEVRDLVEHSVQAVAGQFAGIPDVKLQVQVGADLPAVVVDRDRLTQVLINLLNNAAKFTRAGTVQVSAALNSKGQIQIAVQDTGSGIPVEYLDKVFEKFQQATGDTLIDKPQGTGLGLPICREIVQHYGGRIWAESQLGKGSSFIFTLPVQEQPGPAAAPAAPGHDSRMAPLILTVDDDPGVQGLLVQLLENDGYRVVVAGDGKTALDMARAHSPDLITMDLMMPVMDGYTAIEELRKDPVTAQIPIVVISVLDEDVRVDSEATLKKPVNETLLLDSIRSLLKKDPGLQPCLVLEPADQDLILPSMRVGSVERLEEEALWKRLDAGFCGIVVTGHRVLKDQALARLYGYDAIQVVIVPQKSAAEKPESAVEAKLSEERTP